jgi:mono/diheme cytochrome c family protein
MVRNGFDHYEDMCAGCHGGPGIERSEIGKGLNPPAPNLADAVPAWSPRQLFWIVKNGLKMTGMPSFAALHRRRGDRITIFFAAQHGSASGTKRTSRRR